MQLSVAVRNAILTLGIVAALWAATSSFAQAERITNFDVTIVVEETSDLTITERITYDFQGAKRHGIFREILSDHAQPATAWYKTRRVELEPVSVTRNGTSEPWQDEGSGGDLYLRIGDANKTITGEHVYELTYTARGALSVYDDGLTEVYWNATGNNWDVPIERVTVTVRAAGEGTLAEQQACYTGGPDSASSCQEIVSTTSTTVFRESNLAPGAQVTAAQAVELPQSATVIEPINWLPFVLVGELVWVVGLLVYILRWRRRHDPCATIIAQYEPYKAFKPMFTGVLIDGQLDSRDITAGIVYLAEQGFISIKQTNEKILGLFNTTDYEVTLTKEPSRVSSNAHLDLLRLLFKGQAGLNEVQRSWFGFKLQNKPDQGSTDMSVGKTIRLSDIKKNQTKLKSNYKVVQALKKDVQDDLIERGFYQKRASYRFLWFIPIAIAVSVGASFVAGGIAAAVFWPLFVGLILTLIATNKRRTRKGYEARNHLLGFKDFLSVTDKERFKFHNAPDKSPQQFMEYLPYAIAFGVEKEWAEVFKDIDIAAPDWYSSSVAGAHFSATDFTSDLSSFSSSLASSGSSGSSGGGSAGGGSGGGGGGSW